MRGRESQPAGTCLYAKHRKLRAQTVKKILSLKFLGRHFFLKRVKGNPPYTNFSFCPPVLSFLPFFLKPTVPYERSMNSENSTSPRLVILVIQDSISLNIITWFSNTILGGVDQSRSNTKSFAGKNWMSLTFWKHNRHMKTNPFGQSMAKSWLLSTYLLITICNRRGHHDYYLIYFIGHFVKLKKRL